MNGRRDRAHRTRAALLTGALCVVALVGGRAQAEDPAGPTVVTLEGPADVQGLMQADVDGDRVADLLLVEGRTVLVYQGRRRGLPEAKPTWRASLPEDVSYVDAAGDPARPGPALVVLGVEGVRRVPLGDAKGLSLPGVHLDWTDARKVALVDFRTPGGWLLLPRADGVLHLPPPGSDQQAVLLPATPSLEVERAGLFLGDSARVVQGHSRVLTTAAPEGAPEGSPPVLWGLSGRRVVAAFGQETVSYDICALEPGGDRDLLDLDGDGTPELIQHLGTNREGRYAFWRLPPLTLAEGKLQAPECEIAAPTTTLRLEGYRLIPDYVDLDGDGRKDFVVTTIPIDARNTARALTGSVTASTRAFLNRDSGQGGRIFPASPDASITSAIGVAIRFKQSGNIDVQRSFTILATADYDGDGRKDLAIRTAPDELTIHHGTAPGVWSKEPSQVVPIPSMAESPDIEGYPGDLTGDGRAEIVLLYRKPYGGRDQVRVLRP